jgi:hypothetical protein
MWEPANENAVNQARLGFREWVIVCEYGVRSCSFASRGANLYGDSKLAFTKAAHRRTAGLRGFAKNSRE